MSAAAPSTTTDPLLRDFVVESIENLAEIENLLLTIEQAGDAANVELLNDVFRRVHTVKGIAGFLGLDRIMNLGHALENVLSRMREKKLSPTSETIESILKGSDLLRRMVLDVERSNEYDCDAEIAELKAVVEGKSTARVEKLLDVVERNVATIVEPPKPAAVATSTTAPIAVQTVAPAAEPAGAAPTAALATVEHVARIPAPAPAEPAPATKSPAPPAATAAGADSGSGATIRVAVSVLENLVNLAGEMVLARNQMLRAIHSKRRSNLNAVGIKLDQVTTAMQDAIMGARMQPVETVFSRFPRMVRELSRKLNKPCRLVVEGADVELDRTILEAIVDPLTHLIRNSLDHGLENPAGRKAAEKSAEGELRLCAFRRAGKVHITLSDDGKGIDRKRVSEKAASQGLISQHQAATMSDRDIYQLIFKPGFSTAEQISDVSGRGVGMDVVKSHIERVGGTVGVESVAGKGATVHISLPLTLAILPAWIVRQNDFRIAVPESSIIEMIRLNVGEAATKIEWVDDAAVLRWRGQLLPLVQLDELLNTKSDRSRQASEARNVIVLETGWMRYGLVVDRINDPEQIVVKPLGKHLASFPYLDGAAVLGDGRVAYVLDVSGVAAQSGLSSRGENGPKLVEETTTIRETQTALLFRTSDGRMAAISRMMIQRIERVDSADVRRMHGRYAVAYSDRMMPLVTLREDMPAPSGFGYLLVFHASAEEIGLWASELVDIREVPTTVDARLRSTPGSLGTVVVDGEPVELLDVFELADGMTEPSPTAAATRMAARDEATTTTILLAEDVQFFRQQVRRFLTRAGYRVFMAENGAKAWEFLQGRSEPVDIVLTDIEMPVMNGIELCQRIKADAEFSHLPVIALTALNGEADLRRGRDVGIHDWQVKLDRDRLLSSIRAIVRNAAVCDD